jgi:hypothetical protein
MFLHDEDVFALFRRVRVALTPTPKKKPMTEKQEGDRSGLLFIRENIREECSERPDEKDGSHMRTYQ